MMTKFVNSRTTPDTEKTYWANGLLKSIDNGVSKSDYAYNTRNLLTSEIQTLSGRPARTVSYGYDADGLRANLEGGTGVPPVSYAWTARAQLQALSAGGPPPLASYTYDKAGRNTAVVHENGLTESKSYDSAGQLLGNTHLKGGSPVSGHGYTLDSSGRRTAETFADGSTPARSYGYDFADQVTSADYGSSQTDTYNYDPMGNRTTASMASQGGATTTYTANNANQYTAISGWSAPTHDPNGNLLQQNGVTYIWGNHDYDVDCDEGDETYPRELTHAIFEEIFGELPYQSVDFGGFKFLLTNGQLGESWDAESPLCDTSLGSYGEEQLAWIESELGQGKPTFVMSHYMRILSFDQEEGAYASLPALLDAHGHGGGIDRGRPVVARQHGQAVLMRAAGEFDHLRGRQFVGRDESDVLYPLDPRAAIPSGHDQSHRRAVVRGERQAVHARGEKRARGREQANRDDPAGTWSRPSRRLAVVVFARDQHRRRVGRADRHLEHTDQRHAVPLHGAHQSEVLRVAVAGALDEVHAHWSRGGQQLRRHQRTASLARRPRHRDRPPGGVVS